MTKKSKNYSGFIKLVGIAVALLALTYAFGSKAATSTTAATINYADFADTKVMPWLDKMTLFLVTFMKQVGALFQQIFTKDFLNIGLKFLKGIWDFILGIFKLFIDLLTQSFKK